MTSRTSPYRGIDNEPAPAAPVGGQTRAPRWLSPRRLLALGLLAVSAVMAAGQFHAAQTSAAVRDPYLKRATLNFAQQRDGILTIDAPLTAGVYSVDLIFPGGSPPLDFGIAYQEARKHVIVEVTSASQSAPLLSVPNRETLAQFEDQLDSRSGVELCSFRANSDARLIIHYHFLDGPPWPEQVSIGLSYSSGQPTIRARDGLVKASQPFSFGFSALLVCASISLLWRPASL